MGTGPYTVDNPTDVTLVTTAETVVATLTGVSTDRPGRQLRFHGETTVTTGGSTTALVLRVRADSLTGAVVGEAITDQVEAAAGSTETHDIVTADVTGAEVAARTYVLTVSQTGAAANGTAVHSSLECEVA